MADRSFEILSEWLLNANNRLFRKVLISGVQYEQYDNERGPVRAVTDPEQPRTVQRTVQPPTVQRTVQPPTVQRTVQPPTVQRTVQLPTRTRQPSERGDSDDDRAVFPRGENYRLYPPRSSSETLELRGQPTRWTRTSPNQPLTIREHLSPTQSRSDQQTDPRTTSTSLLSQTARQFAQIPPSRYRDALTFIEANRSVLEEDHQKFFQEAIAALRERRLVYARSCVQQALILQKCEDRSMSHVRAFLTGLSDPNQNEYTRDFLGKFDRMWTVIERQAGVTNAGADDTRGQKSGRGPDAGPPGSGANTTGTKSSQTIRDERSRSPSRTLGPNAATNTNRNPQGERPRDMDPAPKPGQVVVGNKPSQTTREESSRSPTRAPDPRPTTNTLGGFQNVRQGVRETSAPDPRPTTNTPGGFQNVRQGVRETEPGLRSLNTSSVSQTSQIDRRGQPGPRPGPQQGTGRSRRSQGSIDSTRGENNRPIRLDLDVRHVVRRSSFFVQGRVFAMLWHEPHGGQALNTLGSTERFESTAGPFNQMIHTHIKRFIVVSARTDSGHSNCISINTYGGQGLKKPGFNRHHYNEHTIVYMNGIPPAALPNEPAMSKTPIRVEPTSSEQRLNKASRLNLAKMYSVEHNWKVMDIGVVEGNHLRALLEYFREVQRNQ